MRITIARTDLERMTKRQMLEWYKEHVNDEVDLIYWNSFTKQQWVEMLSYLIIEA